MGRIEKLRRLAETYKAEHGPMVGLAFIDKVKDGWEVALLYMKDMTKRGEYLRRRFLSYAGPCAGQINTTPYTALVNASSAFFLSSKICERSL